MRTLKWISCICAIMLCLSGCSLFLPADTDTAKSESYHDADKYNDLFYHHLQYSKLDSDAQHAYGQIYTALCDDTDAEITVTENGKKIPGIRIPLGDTQLSSHEMAQLFEAFFHDNPQFFYLDRTYSLEGSEQDGETLYDTVILRFTHDLAERTLASQQLDAVMQEIFADCPNTTDEYEIELYLHDQLLARCKYDEIAAAHSSAEYANAYSAYGALVEGKAVCEGYAKAMQLLLHKANITSTVVLGSALSDQEAHMWNLVKINGSYYYLDPTWNDDNTTPYYAFFNITTAMLNKTCTLLDEQLITIECTATTDNYHIRNGTFIRTYERDSIAAVIAEKVNAGATVIHLRFEEGKFENGLLFLKNSALTQRKVNPHLLNNKQMWEYDLLTNRSQNSITLHKIA